MNIVRVLLAIAGFVLFPEAAYSDKPSALMKALTSPQAGMYANGENLLQIFVQPRDGASTVRNVEALDTIYFVTTTGIEAKSGGYALLTFQIDKTSSHLALLSYKAESAVPIGTAFFDPTGLPNIDFEWAWKEVKRQAAAEHGVDPSDFVIGKVGIAHAMEPDLPLLISFDFKPASDDGEYCWEWVYDHDGQTIYNSGFIVGCWFIY